MPQRQCVATSTTTGEQCRKQPIAGGTVCRSHGGAAPKVAANAAVRAEVMAWKLGTTAADPGEILLRLVTQSAARVELYSQLLQQAFDAAERLKAAHDAEQLIHNLDADEDPEHEDSGAIQSAKEDLRRIFNVGGLAALVGNTYSDTKTGSVYATGEQIRGLAKLEADERDRCAGFAAKAVAAGLAERQVRLAERQASQLVAIMHAVVAQLGHDPSSPAVTQAITSQLRLIAGGKAA